MKKDPIREEAVFKRYGKRVEILSSNKGNDKGEIIEGTCQFKTEKGNIYTLTEYLKDGLTDLVIMKYADKERKYKDYLRAEVSLMDMIGEE